MDICKCACGKIQHNILCCEYCPNENVAGIRNNKRMCYLCINDYSSMNSLKIKFGEIKSIIEEVE